jgi:hypothetical protein
MLAMALRPSSALLFLLLTAVFCTASPADAPATTPADMPAAADNPSPDDLLLVDCRLPPKINRVGNRTYPVRRPPIRTTAVDCRIRGGEYTVYDRANYETSLKFWLDEASKGNHDAEYYVGKIYEGGLGTTPDYAAAARWYEKAASAGHSASQFSLGSLYEKGLGVPADSAKAFSLYRRAAGLPDNFVIVESGKYEALEKAANDLAEREEEIADLQHQLDDAKKQQQQDAKRQQELQQKLDDQKRKAEGLKNDLVRLKGLVRSAVAAAPPIAAPAQGNLGRFYALVIGNGQYEQLPAVASAEHDAKAMDALLRDAYGFQTTLLLNAKNAQILSKLYQLSQTLTPNDNLLVYYAGHGKRDLRNRRGWWLPVDAASDAGAKTNWLPNQEVSDRLALIPARHILVLADASYVGDITRGAPQPEPQNMTPAQWAKYIETTKSKRARLALSSGADEPLGSGQSSRFTSTAISVLQKQKGVFPASRLHRELVNALTADQQVTSVPTFAPLQSAFHDGVDFLFERR